ncbi:MAG: hypothetical protein ACXVB1_04255 [Pseudobdellovibrionaceae bacterium]
MLRFKFNFKALVFTLALGFSHFSWALDVQENPSSFLSNSLGKILQTFVSEDSYSELKEKLWADYLAQSERYAQKFTEVAQENQTSLKEYMCASADPSESAKKLQSFQSKTINDFDLKKERDQVEIDKLEQLQKDFKEICQSDKGGLALNAKASLVIAETAFYPIYISARDQLIAFLGRK